MPKVKGGRPSKSDKRSKVTNAKAGTKKSQQLPNKKKKPSNELAVIAPSSQAVSYAEILPPEEKKKLRLRRKRLRALAKLKDSQLAMDIPGMFDLIEDTGSLDDVQRQFLTSCLRAVINVLPELEHELLTAKSESKAYMFKAMLSEGREIFHDIRALANTQLVALRIADYVIDPAFANIANIFVSGYHSLRAKSEALVPDADKPALRQHFQDVGKVFGASLTMIQQDVKDKILNEIE